MTNISMTAAGTNRATEMPKYRRFFLSAPVRLPRQDGSKTDLIAATPNPMAAASPTKSAGNSKTPCGRIPHGVVPLS